MDTGGATQTPNSADQSNAQLQRLLRTKLSITVATVYIQDSWTAEPLQGGCWRFPILALAACCASAAQPMLMAPAEECREAQSTRQSPKAKTKAVEDFEA